MHEIHLGDLEKYIREYDFKKDLINLKTKLLTELSEYKEISSDAEVAFKSFVVEFWKKPSTNISSLKNKFSISKNIPFNLIIKACPSDEYIEFLKYYWDYEVPIKDIVELYGIKYDTIIKLGQPIIFTSSNNYCSNCFESNSFVILDDIQNIKNRHYTCICRNCEKNLYQFLTEEEAICERESNLKKLSEFKNSLVFIKQKVAEIKCPSCGFEKLEVKEYIDRLSYNIICSKCRNHWDDIDNVIESYKIWCRRAAMMAAIRKREEEIIQNSLKKKDSPNLITKVEELITRDEGLNTINFAFEHKEDSIESWSLLLKDIRQCMRTEKILLKELIELSKAKGTKTVWTNTRTGDNVIFIKYSPDEPLIIELFARTKLLNIRNVLRKLIKKNIIICDEKDNYFDINPLLIERFKDLDKYFTPQNISNDIKHLVYKRHDYTCYNCSETERPLKIAFLSVDKNILNLDTMVALCDTCFFEITENEVLIDTFLTFNRSDSVEGMLASWRFLINYIPEIKEDDQAFKQHSELSNTYGEEALIKSIAITLSYIRNDKKEFSSIFIFYRYVEGIIKKSMDGISVPKNVEREFNLNEWLAKI